MPHSPSWSCGRLCVPSGGAVSVRKVGGDVGQEGNLHKLSMAEGLWCVHLLQISSVHGKQRCVVEHLLLREQKPVAFLLGCLLHRGDGLWLLHFSLVSVGFAESLLFATGTSCDPTKKTNLHSCAG